MPTPERNFLAIFGAKKRLKAEDPFMPKPWAESLEKQIRAAWRAGLHAARIASTIALLTAHLKCLVDATSGELHTAALDALGLDSVTIDESMDTTQGRKFLEELAQLGST